MCQIYHLEAPEMSYRNEKKNYKIIAITTNLFQKNITNRKNDLMVNTALYSTLYQCLDTLASRSQVSETFILSQQLKICEERIWTSEEKLDHVW